MTKVEPWAYPPKIEIHPDRASERASLQVQIAWDGDDNFFTGLTDNISEGGVFIATFAPRERGERVAFELTLPGDDRPIACIGEVRWTRLYSETSDAPPGMGLRFLDLSARDAAAITRYVARHTAIFWDDSVPETGAPTTCITDRAPPRVAPVSSHAGPVEERGQLTPPTWLRRQRRAIRASALSAALSSLVAVALAGGRPPAPSAPAHEAQAALVAPPPAVASAAPRPVAPAAPAPTPSAPAPDAGVSAPSAPDPATLPPTEGLLVVDSASLADVYLNGKLLGPTGAPLRSPCGRRFLRLAVHAPTPPAVPSWAASGGGVVVNCRALTTVKR